LVLGGGRYVGLFSEFGTSAGIRVSNTGFIQSGAEEMQHQHQAASTGEHC